MIDRTPKVFISYSWTTQNETIDLAEKLINDGVNVVLDVWELNLGHDKYAFMEQCVTAEDIDRVLMICDKSYAEKANERRGGVGDETMIISPEIYGKAKQEKFIPVAIETEESGKPYLPAYLKSRMYVDLTGDNYEDGYKKLLRTIYEQPERRKPEISQPPAFLFKEESASIFPLKKAVQKLKTNINDVTAKDFINIYSDSLKGFYKRDCQDINIFLENFRTMKEHRDYFLQFLKTISESQRIDLGAFLARAFEDLYNTLYNLRSFEPHQNGCTINDFDIFKIHIWELFLCPTTYLLHHELFADLHKILVHSYFLRTSPIGDDNCPLSYGAFYPEYLYMRALDEKLKHNIPELNQRLTPIGYLMCKERTYLPVCTENAIAKSDLFLFQVHDALDLGIENASSWYPTCYIYADGIYHSSIWQKLRSLQFCKKIFKLFGVENIENLKQHILKCNHNNATMYGYEISPAPSINNFINVQDIGTIP